MKQNKLHHIKETGFKTPEDYFNGLEDRVLSDIKFKDMSSDSGFKLPDNYFDTLEDAVAAKIASKAPPKIIPLFSKKTIIYASSVAAALLLLFNLSIFENKPTFDALDSETIETYIMNETISSYEIAAMLSQEDLKEEDFVDYQVEEETIENYILNNLDIDDIVIE